MHINLYLIMYKSNFIDHNSLCIDYIFTIETFHQILAICATDSFRVFIPVI